MVAPSVEPRAVERRSGRDGSVVWSVAATGSGRSRPLEQDVDGDQRDDVFSAGAEGTVTRLDAEGEVVWRTVFSGLGGEPSGASGQISLADLDHDGTFELLSGWEDGVLRVFDTQSEKLEWAFHTGGEIEAAPVAVDVDSDGLDEVIVASHAGKLYCLATPR